MRFLFLAVTLALPMASLVPGQQKPQSQAARSDKAKRFLGTWKLVSIVSNGKINPAYGNHPVGMICYDKTGHMAVQIMPDRLRPKFAGSAPTPDEAKSAIAGYIAYFGSFTINEKSKTVTHHRDGSLTPGMVGVDLVRRYEFESGDRLVLTPVEAPTGHLTWERIR